MQNQLNLSRVFKRCHKKILLFFKLIYYKPCLLSQCKSIVQIKMYKIVNRLIVNNALKTHGFLVFESCIFTLFGDSVIALNITGNICYTLSHTFFTQWQQFSLSNSKQIPDSSKCIKDSLNNIHQFTASDNITIMPVNYLL